MQARFALDVARDLQVPIESYSRAIYSVDPITVVGDIDVETPHVQIEYTYGPDLTGKVGQWNRMAIAHDLANPIGKGRLLYAPEVTDKSIEAARSQGVNAFNDYKLVIQEIRSFM